MGRGRGHAGLERRPFAALTAKAPRAADAAGAERGGAVAGQHVCAGVWDLG